MVRPDTGTLNRPASSKLPGQLVEVSDLHLERCLQFLGSGRDELQCPHAAPSDIGETVEGGQVPHTDMMHFGPFVEHGVSPMVVSFF